MKRTAANFLGVTCAGLLMTIAVMVALNQPDRGDIRTASQRKADANFIAAQLEAYKHPRRSTSDTAIMEVWNLTEADVAKPVDLWGMK